MIKFTATERAAFLAKTFWIIPGLRSFGLQTFIIMTHSGVSGENPPGLKPFHTAIFGLN